VTKVQNKTSSRMDSYKPFYGWLILFGLMLFGAFLLWWHSLWQIVFTQDQTYLSGVILVLFLITTLYLGHCAWKLSQEQRLTTALVVNESVTSNTSSSRAADYLELLQQSQKHSDGGLRVAESLQARLIEQVHGNHSSGWFLSDLLLRLGLLGTVIGFVLMLSSVVGLQDEGINALKQVLASMSSGMQVALLTTLTGLGSAMLVSLQCHWLDRCADQLVSHIIEISASPHALSFIAYEAD